MLEVSDRLDLAGETQAICNIGGMTSHTARVRLIKMFGYKIIGARGEEISKTRDLGGFCQINNRKDKTL